MKRGHLANILVTGTPGTGKTTLCRRLTEVLNKEAGVTSSNRKYKHEQIGAFIAKSKLYREWDDELNVPIFDEDLVANHLEKELGIGSDDGGHIVDFHSGEFLPLEWFDIVVILRAHTDVLFDRLNKRGYSEKKRQENLDSEIFQVVSDAMHQAIEDADVKLRVIEGMNNTYVDQARLIDLIVAELPN